MVFLSSWLVYNVKSLLTLRGVQWGGKGGRGRGGGGVEIGCHLLLVN